MAFQGTWRRGLSLASAGGRVPWRAIAYSAREAPTTVATYTAVAAVIAVRITSSWAHPQYCCAIGTAGVRPDAVSFCTFDTGTAIENIQEFSAQNTPTPSVAMRVATGSRRRGACASSATVEMTS